MTHPLQLCCATTPLDPLVAVADCAESSEEEEKMNRSHHHCRILQNVKEVYCHGCGCGHAYIVHVWCMLLTFAVENFSESSKQEERAFSSTHS